MMGATSFVNVGVDDWPPNEGTSANAPLATAMRAVARQMVGRIGCSPGCYSRTSTYVHVVPALLDRHSSAQKPALDALVSPFDLLFAPPPTIRLLAERSG
jgi:hypothetical protein